MSLLGTQGWGAGVERETKPVKYSSIPKKFREIETDRQDLIKKHYGKSLYIWGDVGVGKSVFMASLAKKYIENGGVVEKNGEYYDTGIYVNWYNMPELLIELKSGFNKGSEISPYCEAERIASSKGYLLLDDLGAEGKTDFSREIVEYIVNEREVNESKLIITSNLALGKLPPRIASRIVGICGNDNIIKFTGKDRRR